MGSTADQPELSGIHDAARDQRLPAYNAEYLQETTQKSRYGPLHMPAEELGAAWTRKNVDRSNHSLHGLVPRLGGFPPSLAAWLIKEYSQPGDQILDMFCGKGTAVLEALLANREATGNDVAPDAYVTTTAKTQGVTHDELLHYARGLTRLRVRKEAIEDVSSNVRTFFSDGTLAQILTIRRRLLQDAAVCNTACDERMPHVARYALACLAGILHGPHSQNGREPQGFYLSLNCSHTHSQAPEYVRKYAATHNLVPPDKNVIDCLRRKSETAQKDGVPKPTATVLCEKAEQLSLSRRFRLVLTSPPYFRSQSYAWDNWLRLWLLGYPDYREVQKQLIQTESIPHYAHMMRMCCERMAEALVPGGFLVLIAGDVRQRSKGMHSYLDADDRRNRYLTRDPVKGSMINASEILLDICVDLGLEPQVVINDYIDRSDRALRAFLTSGHGSDIDRIAVVQKPG